ncbi:MAG: YIP1 family protein [Butyrivibrio sp.]|uniref:YIP1 family protein n=1 Tax=Butyrivibrio sp. TaxID=28121 RepID=UPI0025D299BC|nr:YIP1 family protein [Butyrivibrio sp.]MCR5770079.1 YIP1 family protein [Butyrivibrio sp.]
MLYGKSLKYIFHLIFHPFDGFWDLKFEKRGSLGASLTIVILTIITLSIEKQGTGFLYNMNRLSELNIVVDILTIVLLYVLWCTANWCTTSLMEGKGRMIDILIAVGYSFAPIVLVRLPLVAVSHVITSNEGSFYLVFKTISVMWALLLLFLGTMITHQYSVKKTIATCIITVIGMGIIMFIGLLFFNVIGRMITFVATIYKELRFR